jgi:streptogrisin C
MQRRRIVAAAAMVTAAGAAVAFTLPSMAGTGPSGGGSSRPSAAGPGADVSPEILAAMRRDLGVDGDEARARLQRQQWASGVTAELRAETGGTYAGSWLAEDGTTLNVAVTDAAMADEVRATGANPKIVERSEQDLDAAKKALDASAGRADRELPGWYVDVASNKVVVLANPGDGDRARSLVDEAGLDADSVKIVTTESRPKPLADIRGGDAYLINGNARCTIGFAVVGGFVTAGHCGAEGAPTTGLDQAAQGVVEDSVFPGNADMGFVAVDNDEVPRPVVNDRNGNELPVAGSTEAPIGAAVCRSGSTTGTFCGTIRSKNRTVNYPEGAVTGLTGTDVCAEGGDSGGPWLAGDQAQGVTSGGSGDCSGGPAETFFQPVNEILAASNLTLLTTGNAGDQPPANQPPAEQPPADNGDGGDEGNDQGATCQDLAADRAGELPRAGTGQLQPDRDGFQAGAGEQAACLDAPVGADFDLFLQRLTADGFATVAEATGAGDKQLSFDGPAGTYRYVVASTSGNGSYTLRFDAS